MLLRDDFDFTTLKVPLYGETFSSSLARQDSSRKSSIRSREMRDWLNTSLQTRRQRQTRRVTTVSPQCHSVVYLNPSGATLTLSPPSPRPCAGFRRGASSCPSAPGSRRRPRRQTPCASRGWGCLVWSRRAEPLWRRKKSNRLAVCLQSMQPRNKPP